MKENATCYIGDEHGTHWLTINDGKVVGTDVTSKELSEFLLTAERLGFKVGTV